jgi:hypothetical protein
MKGTFVWFCLLAPLSCYASDVTLKIEPNTQGGYVASPRSLELKENQTTRLHLNTPGAWQCFVAGIAIPESPDLRECKPLLDESLKSSTGGKPFLVVRSKMGNAEVIVPVTLSRERDWLPLLAATCAAVPLAISFFLLLGLRKRSNSLAATLSEENMRIEGYIATVADIGEILHISEPAPEKPVSSARSTGPQSRLGIRTSANDPTTATAELRGRVQEFLDRIESWQDLVRPTPDEITRGRVELRELEDRIRPGFDPDVSFAEFRRIAEAVARVAVNATDTRFDREHENARLQKALDDLVAEAELSPIQPRRGERFNELNHHPIPPSESATSPQHRGLIASVIRRGLKRDNTVISRADVTLFD